VRSADGDENARFTNFEPAEAMDNRGAVDGIFFVKLLADFAHFSERHGFVGFVIEVEGGAIVGLIANEAVEGDDGAVHGGAKVPDECRHVDRLAHEFKNVVGRGRGHSQNLAATHRWKEGDFVASVQRRVPGRKLLIAGGNERRTVFGEFGNTCSVESE